MKEQDAFNEAKLIDSIWGSGTSLCSMYQMQGNKITGLHTPETKLVLYYETGVEMLQQ